MPRAGADAMVHLTLDKDTRQTCQLPVASLHPNNAGGRGGEHRVFHASGIIDEGEGARGV